VTSSERSALIDPTLAPSFDEQWKWMGSYLTWRAAMFVFLYPENLLIPNLRRRDATTEAFRQLVDALRSNRALTPGSRAQRRAGLCQVLPGCLQPRVGGVCRCEHTRKRSEWTR
jgi:ABC toxin-like protein